MLKLAISNVRRSRWRTNLLIFGIIVTIALETGIVVTVDTIYEDFLFNNWNQNFTGITVNPKEIIELNSLKTLAEAINKVPCKHAQKKCFTEEPPLEEIEKGHFSSCWYPQPPLNLDLDPSENLKQPTKYLWKQD